MNNWQLAAKAIETGIKIRCSKPFVNPNEYIYFRNRWMHSDGKTVIRHIDFDEGTWTEYHPPKPVRKTRVEKRYHRVHLDCDSGQPLSFSQYIHREPEETWDAYQEIEVHIFEVEK